MIWTGNQIESFKSESNYEMYQYLYVFLFQTIYFSPLFQEV